ncbi:DUF2382 domain-containing protein [Cellulomonas carbonis]|uniref:Photosystem reaction center subunit H n=1 Tax=Cellulomonas carbonis T26 TaxID=947969 RepID=A0A0A0BPT9_9CELL|nr:PRC and DUF2382 domain-containing protein [Cellulomonas carbonis]KGM09961.1 hypothetical protein N868_17535 [Cellulomonas carbonis T26]GGC16720.1 photosystem reaction center subunit H [Cellulomonas carbonis]
MITTEQAQTIVGTTVHGTDGEKIGTVGQVYFDDATGQVAWATVRTGLFGTKETFVPLDQATLRDGDVTVPYDKELIKSAPSVEADDHLSEAEEAELYRHYGLGYGNAGDASGTTDTYASGTTGTYASGTADTYGTTDAHGTTDTRGTARDDAMTLSEERLDVGTERREAGRARLRKYVVTEDVTTTVPVTREEVRLEREPITDANRDRALDGPEISEAEHEVVLHEERPVVAKETVPVERVRLETDEVTTQETVTDEVRKERVETDGDANLR